MYNVQREREMAKDGKQIESKRDGIAKANVPQGKENLWNNTKNLFN